MTGDGDQRALQTPRHILHEAGLAAACWAFQQYRQLVAISGLKEGDLITGGLVVGSLFTLYSSSRSILFSTGAPIGKLSVGSLQ